MKKVMKDIMIAAALTLVVGNAFAAGEGVNVNENAICELMDQLRPIFRMLKNLAFIGAAFTIAGWAYGFVTKPDDVKLDALKGKGTGMFVGFLLLFGIAWVLQFLSSATGANAMGCVITGW